ncbi:MAG: hypothetical protein E6G68_08465 [Actinobacteria bacterium]|nr:MAG: hypothetical protein E6G68_08465 [Actinomycetota bacterium]
MQAVSLNAQAGPISAQCLSTERLAEVALARGQRWEASRLLSRAKRLSQRSLLVSHLAALGVVVDSETALARRDVCDPCSMTFRVASAIASARGGDLDRAARYLEDAERLAGMWQGGPWSAAVWEARGVLREAHGERDQAAALFREAAESFARVGRTLDVERCEAAVETLHVS